MKYVHGLHNCYELIKSGEKRNCSVIVVFLFNAEFYFIRFHKTYSLCIRLQRPKNLFSRGMVFICVKFILKYSLSFEFLSRPTTHYN